MSLAKHWSLPLRNEPWFMLPVVTKWERTETGGLEAVEITEYRIRLMEMPSLVNTSHLELAYMAALIRAENQAEQEALDGGTV